MYVGGVNHIDREDQLSLDFIHLWMKQDPIFCTQFQVRLSVFERTREQSSKVQRSRGWRQRKKRGRGKNSELNSPSSRCPGISRCERNARFHLLDRLEFSPSWFCLLFLSIVPYACMHVLRTTISGLLSYSLWKFGSSSFTLDIHVHSAVAMS